MTRSVPFIVATSSVTLGVARRSQVGFSSLEADEQPALRSDLTACPCTIWRHCSTFDILPEEGELGVACVASEDAIISMGHQVQCVPHRHGGLNYYCPPILSHKCDPGAQCIETDLDSCAEFNCVQPEWLPKASTAPFCAMTECTHVECCDRGPILVTAAPEAPPQPQTMTCPEMINALAEPTLERIQAYVNDCNFNAGDVNYGASEFDLTQGGEAKLWDERCQSVAALQNSPHDVLADGQALQARCDDPRLQAQMSSVGIFATAATLDRVWRAAPGRPAPVAPENRVNLPPVPIEVLPPAPAAVMITTLPPTTAAPTASPQDSCLGTFTFTLQLGSDGEQHEQTFILNSAPEGKEEHLQCDAGPFRYGTLNMLCQNSNWVMTNTASPCFDTEEGATQSMGNGMTGGYMPTGGEVLRLVDVTAIVARLQNEDDSAFKCCCDARLDANLRANSWSHRRWNRREHSGICTIYENIRSCSRTNSETHSHRRAEGGQCIVREDEQANWRPILRLDRTTASHRSITPNVPTVPRQEAEEYENCVPPHSINECERCTHDVQCAEGSYCCPYMKLCVQNGETQCPAGMVAGCSRCFPRWHPNPEDCEERCNNPSFPRTWLPECHTGGWFR